MKLVEHVVGRLASEFRSIGRSGMIKLSNIESSEVQWVESKLNCYYLYWLNRVTWRWYVRLLRFFMSIGEMTEILRKNIPKKSSAHTNSSCTTFKLLNNFTAERQNLAVVEHLTYKFIVELLMQMVFVIGHVACHTACRTRSSRAPCETCEFRGGKFYYCS